MPTKSKAQYKFMKAVQHNPEFAKKAGVDASVGKEMTKGNVGKKAFSKLKEKLKNKK